MKVLVTGSAGFIGAAVSGRLLARGDQVIGVDNLDPYYDVELKRARLATSALLEFSTWSGTPWRLSPRSATDPWQPSSGM